MTSIGRTISVAVVLAIGACGAPRRERAALTIGPQLGDSTVSPRDPPRPPPNGGKELSVPISPSLLGRAPRPLEPAPIGAATEAAPGFDPPPSQPLPPPSSEPVPAPPPPMPPPPPAPGN